MEKIQEFLEADFWEVQLPVVLIVAGFIYFIVIDVRKRKKK